MPSWDVLLLAIILEYLASLVASTSRADILNVKFKGLTIPRARRGIDEYVEFLEDNYPEVARQLEKTPFVKFQ